MRKLNRGRYCAALQTISSFIEVSLYRVSTEKDTEKIR